MNHHQPICATTGTPAGTTPAVTTPAATPPEATFEVTMRDGTVQPVFDADAYEPERQMTTFYQSGNSRTAIDGWSVRLASFRTDEILMIRRCAVACGRAETASHRRHNSLGVADRGETMPAPRVRLAM